MRPREHQHFGVLLRVQRAVAEVIAAINLVLAIRPYTFSAGVSFVYMVWKAAKLLDTPTALLRIVPHLMLVVAIQ